MKKLIMILALVGALSLISVASAQFNSSQTWGSFGNGIGQFYGISGAATDISGNIYVAELDNRVQKFSGNGTYITQFNIPARNLAIDSSGNIYATVNDSIKKFDSTGKLLNTWGSTGTGNGYFNFPTGIALDSSRNIYVSDMDNNRIQKLNSSGNYVTGWGTLGSGNGSLKSPAGIAVSGNYVYVADMGNYRIQKFDLNGSYVSSLGNKGTGNTQFNSSIAVASDSSGNIYVTDYYNGRVLEYDSNFNYLTQYTGFSYPTALVVANNNLYVLDSGNYRVYEYYNRTANQSIPPVANFTADPTQGDAPLSVRFNDSSINATAWSWNFGDDQTSTVQNPSHTYSTPGTYTVSLNASNAYGYNISTKPNLITVNPTTPPVPGLVVYYDGNLSGNSLADLSGNNNTGYATSVTQGTNQATGANYINFNGVNSKVDVANNAQTNVSSPMTIEFIGSINEFKKYGTVVSKYYNWSTGWYLSSSSADPYNHARFGSSLKSGFNLYEPEYNLVQGQVYDIIVTYNNNITRMYINGEEIDERTWNSPAIGNSGNITIGYRSGSTYGNVSMYTFRLYNRALSPDEVLQNYNSDVGRYSGYTTKATPTITWSNPAAITYGTALSATQLDASASVPGSFVYTPASGTVLYAGTHTLQVTFTPADTTNYATSSSSVSLTVNKATPLITWSNPADITYGTALNNTQLDASASVSGTFVYTPASGTVLSAGTHTLHVDFTPTDAANYAIATADVTINVLETTRATPTVTWSNPAAIIYGTALSGTQLNASASVPGSFVYNPVSGTILGAGTQTLQTTFTPTDTTNYTTASSSVSLTVNKATPLITWNNPANINFGTALSKTQLNANASVPGSFVYTPASGTILFVGTRTLHVDFTPSDATNYTTASGSVSINVVINAPVTSSSGSNKYSPVKQKILEPNNTQPLNSSEDIGEEIESESGNKTINEDIGTKIESESGNKTTKGLQIEQKESQSIPGFGIYCGVACLLGVFLYKRK